MSAIVIEFVTLDGVVQDPDGSAGTPTGGWAFRFGPDAVAGDKFALGPLLDTGTFLLGRTTWQLFSTIWPGRTDEFSSKLNRIPKLVASRTLKETDAWHNSTLLDGDLITEVTRLRADRDLITTGSLSLVRTLAEHDLIDEYRLMVFPTVVGTGQRLFADTAKPTDLHLVSVEQVGPAARMRYRSTPR